MGEVKAIVQIGENCYELNKTQAETILLCISKAYESYPGLTQYNKANSDILATYLTWEKVVEEMERIAK